MCYRNACACIDTFAELCNYVRRDLRRDLSLSVELTVCVIIFQQMLLPTYYGITTDKIGLD